MRFGPPEKLLDAVEVHMPAMAGVAGSAKAA
jgi:hypothetical protein